MRMSARTPAVEICEMEGGECTVSKITANKQFRQFSNLGTISNDQPR